MRNPKLRSCGALLFLVFCFQSLADVAREEAERRKELEQQGIQAKVIQGNGIHLSSEHGNVTTSTGPATAPATTPARADSAKMPQAVRRYQAAIKKLDKEIQQNETRLESLRARLQAEKWAVLKGGRSSSRGRTTSRKDKIDSDIEKTQMKLKQLRDERFEVYSSGRKAGFLPGELDGRGIVP